MSYTDKEYYDRQCIMVVNDDRGLRNSDIDVFTRLNLPGDITFSNGRPVLRTIYVAHPARKGLYIPLAEHEMAMFRDKMDELILLLQALGATDIEIVRTQGMSAEQMNRIGSSIDVGGGWKSNSLSGGYSSSQFQSSSNSRMNGYHLKVKSSNDKYPFVPQGLQWYQLTPEWEKMVKQRMLGLQEYEIELRSSYSSSISSSQMESLKLAAKIIFARLNVSSSSEYESNFKESGEIVWCLRIKFRPLKEYAHNDIQGLSRSSTNKIQHTTTASLSSSYSKQGKTDYRESCKQLIPKNGKISDVIRIELNRLRDESGISADEAASIEAEYLPKKKWYWPF